MMREGPKIKGWDAAIMALAIGWPFLAALAFAIYREVLCGQ